MDVKPVTPWWRRKRWIAAAALTLGTAHLYGPSAGLPDYWFSPLALAVLVAAFAAGTHGTAAAMFRPRLRSGFLRAALVAALLPVPWAARWGLFWLGAHSVPAPASAPESPIRIVHHDPHDWPIGYQVIFQTGGAVEHKEIGRFYRLRLPRRGWRFAWSRDVTFPGMSAVVRRYCFRRLDGCLVVSVPVSGPDRKHFVVAYDHVGNEEHWR